MGFGKRSGGRALRKATGPSQGKNFGLTAAEYSRLAQDLRRGDETLFREVFLSRFAACRDQLCRYDGLSPEAAYDAAMDALLHLRQLIIDRKVEHGNLNYLFTTIARQLHTKKRRRQPPTQPLTGGVEPETTAIPEPDFSEEDYDQLSRALSGLGTECQSLLRRFYFRRITLKDIALQDGRSPVAVRKQKSRCVARLRNFYLLQS